MCDGSSPVAFYFAAYEGPRAGDGEPKQVWAESRSVVLDAPTGVEGEAISDLRIVNVSSAPSFAVGGAVVGGGQRVETGAGEPASGVGSWRLDVALSGDAAARLSEAVEEIRGSYRVLALVIGDEVFSASVDLPIRFGVARIELPNARNQGEARAFFQKQLGCSVGS